MESLFDFGIGLIQVLQMLSPALDALMKFFTFLGTIEFYLVLMPLLYWTVNPRLGIRVLLILISVDAVGVYLKQLLHQPRPYWVRDVINLSTESSYGIPSTHASNTLAVWGFLSYRLKRRWLWISAIVLVLLIGISRLYLGVHFPHDVVGGWLLGAALLYLILKGEQRILPWLQEQSVGLQIGIGFGASVVLILVGLLVGVVISGSPDPAAWAQFANTARSPAHYFTIGGALFGAVAGFVLMLQARAF